MLCLAVTGGIATGKSLFCRQLMELVPGAVLFDADACVAELLEDPGVREEIAAAFGPGALEADGSRIGIFRGARVRQRNGPAPVGGHPASAGRRSLARRAAAATLPASPLFIADVPLLFEHGGDLGHQSTVVVATSPATQARRLQSRSGFDDAMVRAILAAQLPITEKIRRADRVVWNEGPPDLMARQAHLLLSSLTPRMSDNPAAVGVETAPENTPVAAAPPS